jgi:hypothetical protein
MQGRKLASVIHTIFTSKPGLTSICNHEGSKAENTEKGRPARETAAHFFFARLRGFFALCRL